MHDTPDRDDSPAEPITQPEPAPSPRRLTRAVDDRVLGGVAGGLGRYFSVDPIIFRVAFAVLTFTGGAGVLAYLILWVVVPTAEEDAGAASPRSKALVVLGVAALVVAALVFALPPLFFWPDFMFGPGLLALALLAVLGVLLWSASRGEDGSPLGRVLLIAGVTVLALAGGCAAAVASAAGAGDVVAGLVIAIGVALVAAAFAGGARWLILPAFVLAVPLAFVTAAGVDVDGGVGERSYRVASAHDLRPRYELGMGELRIDLRDVDFPPGRTRFAVRMGVGHVEILVPRDVCVGSTVRVGMGRAGVFSRDNGGLDVDWHDVPSARAGVPRLHIDADIGIGALDVGHDVLAFDRFGRGFRDRRFGFGDEPAGNAACLEARSS